MTCCENTTCKARVTQKPPTNHEQPRRQAWLYFPRARTRKSLQKRDISIMAAAAGVFGGCWLAAGGWLAGWLMAG